MCPKDDPILYIPLEFWFNKDIRLSLPYCYIADIETVLEQRRQHEEISKKRKQCDEVDDRQTKQIKLEN